MDRNWITFSIAVVGAWVLTLCLFSETAESTKFTLVNRCQSTIWPGFLSGANSPPLPTSGFTLRPGGVRTVPAPPKWSGRFWARTHCGRDSGGRFACLTADCGSGVVACNGAGAKPPATLVEFTLNGAEGLDFFDVSLVDGFNLPVVVVPRGGAGRGACGPTGCLVDLNGACPAGLRVAAGARGRRVACRSACEALGDPRFCCSEAYSTPETCGPSEYSLYFKRACPRSYSYAYDDTTSTYTCADADYLVVFCPRPYSTLKVLGARKDSLKLPLVNKTMMYLHSRQ